MHHRLRNLVLVGGVGLLLFLALDRGVALVRVVGPSMAPAVEDGDLVLGLKPLTPHRGDVIIFRPNGGGSGDFIKRVIAVPGDTLQIKDAVVKINGQTLVEDYIPEIWTKDVTWSGGQEQVLPPDQYFVMGDNRNHSNDSRSIGTQASSSIDAIVAFRLWPITSLSPVPQDSRLSGLGSVGGATSSDTAPAR